MKRLTPLAIALLLPAAAYAQIRVSPTFTPIRLPVVSSSSSSSSSEAARTLPDSSSSVATSVASSSSSTSTISSSSVTSARVASSVRALPIFTKPKSSSSKTSSARSSRRASVSLHASSAAVTCTRSTDTKRGCVSFVCSNGTKVNTCNVIDQALAETEGTYAKKTKDKCYQHTLPSGCTVDYCNWFGEVSTLNADANSCTKKEDLPHSKPPSGAKIYATDAQGCQYVYLKNIFTVPVCTRYCPTEWATETACPAPTQP